MKLLSMDISNDILDIRIRTNILTAENAADESNEWNKNDTRIQKLL